MCPILGDLPFRAQKFKFRAILGKKILTSGKQGKFFIRVSEQKSPLYLEVSAPGHCGATAAVFPGAFSVNVTLRPLGSLEGRISVPDGAALDGMLLKGFMREGGGSAGAEKSLDGEELKQSVEREIFISADGSFLVEGLCPGDYELGLFFESFTPLRLEGFYLAPGEHKNLSTLRPEQGIPLYGTVLDTTGAAVSGANLILTARDGRPAKQSATGSAGSYEFHGLEELDYQLRVEHPGFAPAVEGVSVSQKGIRSGRGFEHDVILKKGAQIKGLVQDAEGNFFLMQGFGAQRNRKTC
jgi:hypothetical protein